MRRAWTLLVGVLAIALTGCGGPQVPSAPPETARPTETSLAYLPVNADDLKEVLTDSLDFTCPDVDGSDELVWTCSRDNEVTISVYGPSPASVSAIRLVTQARREVDRRSWMRGYASLISVAVFSWVYDHFGSNETAQVDGVWVQTTHDAESDAFLISTEDVGFPHDVSGG